VEKHKKPLHAMREKRTTVMAEQTNWMDKLQTAAWANRILLDCQM
jgi:hypothetical protein